MRQAPVLQYHTRGAARGWNWHATLWAIFAVSLCQVFPLFITLIAAFCGRSRDAIGTQLLAVLLALALAAAGLALAAAERSGELPVPILGALLFNAGALLLAFIVPMCCVYFG
jgi:hypothetical protein